MKALLTQRFQRREPRTPIALMDLAAYGRRFGHEVDVAYDEGQPIAGDYDLVGVSAVVVDGDLVDQMGSLRTRWPGRLVLGGKGTSTARAECRRALEGLGVELFEGPGERFFGEEAEVDYRDYPTWDARDIDLLGAPPTAIELMSSRGCPYRCHFCNNTEPKVRFFSPQRTVANASLLLDRMGRHSIFFVDDIFALRASHMMAILEAADAAGLELRRKTHFFIHVSQVDDDRMAAIDAFRPAEMQVGIESGDDRMLRAMGKTFTATEAEQCLKRLYDAGHWVACLFLMGFPGETPASLRATVDFFTRNRQYMSGRWVSFYQPVPGTKGWDMALERAGREVVGDWTTEITYIDPNLTKHELLEARASVMGD